MLPTILSYLRSAARIWPLANFHCREIIERSYKSTIQASIDRVSNSLAPAHNEVMSAVADQKSIHVDETGWKLKGALVWAWVFCSTSLAVFVLRPSRSADVLRRKYWVQFFQVQYTLTSSQHISATHVRSEPYAGWCRETGVSHPLLTETYYRFKAALK